MGERDDTPSRAPLRAGDRVGLGRVIEDRRPPALEIRRAGPPAEGGAAPGERPGQPDRDARIEEASEESFPASDPPTFTSDQATPGPRDGR
jgi:hypothetical protein